MHSHAHITIPAAKFTNFVHDRPSIGVFLQAANEKCVPEEPICVRTNLTNGSLMKGQSKIAEIRDARSRKDEIAEPEALTTRLVVPSISWDRWDALGQEPP